MCCLSRRPPFFFFFLRWGRGTRGPPTWNLGGVRGEHASLAAKRRRGGRTKKKPIKKGGRSRERERKSARDVFSCLPCSAAQRSKSERGLAACLWLPASGRPSFLWPVRCRVTNNNEAGKKMKALQLPGEGRRGGEGGYAVRTPNVIQRIVSRYNRRRLGELNHFQH